jgi:hypothetical protein
MRLPCALRRSSSPFKVGNQKSTSYSTKPVRRNKKEILIINRLYPHLKRGGSRASVLSASPLYTKIQKYFYKLFLKFKHL